MKQNSTIKNIIFQISAILILLSAVVYYFDPEIAKYTMIIGVIGFGGITFTTPYPGKSLKGKRLFNVQVIAAILMIVAAYLMYVNMKEWVVIMLVAAFQTLYCAVMLPRIYKQE